MATVCGVLVAALIVVGVLVWGGATLLLDCSTPGGFVSLAEREGIAITHRGGRSGVVMAELDA
jgi:hypothetical protein